MKEATGELNMTIVIVLAVGILAAFFYTIIWPLISNNMSRNTQCANAICLCDGNCPNTGLARCHIRGNREEFSCPWKG